MKKRILENQTRYAGSGCPGRVQGACLVCKSSGGRSFFTREGRSFVRCSECGLVYQDPPPACETNEEFYQENYYRSLGDRVPRIEIARTPLYQDVLSRCASACGNRKLLDVGSGYGSFLKMAKDAGWDVWGIEPSRDAGESSRKIFGDRILNRTVEKADFPGDHFDVITLWNVLDYFLDPVSAMAKIYRWLSPDGTLVLRIPNVRFHLFIYRFYSFFQPLFEKAGWKKNPAVFQRANFDAKTLHSLLRGAGFEQIHISNAKLTEGDAYGVSPRKGMMTAAKFFLSSLAQGVLFLSGNRWLIGSSIIAFARKNSDRPDPSDPMTESRIMCKKIVLHFFAVLGYILLLPLWQRCFRTRQALCALLYHSVDPLKHNDMNIRPGEFEKQLDFIRNHYEVLSLEKALEGLKDKELFQKPSVVITFDDGYEDNYRVAYPLLRERNFDAAFFLLTGDEHGERKTSHLGGAYAGDGRLLDWDEAREMANSGMTVGSHGERHARLKDLGREQLRQEIFSSKKKIESQVGRSVQFFSYPYGTLEDFGEREKAMVREAGYRAAFSKVYGVNRSDADLYALKRIGVEASDTLFTLRAKLNGALGLLSLFDWPPMRKIVRRINAFFFPRPKMKKKKGSILLASVDFPPHTDGISTLSRELSVRCAEAGSDFYVVANRAKGAREFDAHQRYRAYRVPGYHWGYLRFIPVFFCSAWVVFHHKIRKVFAMSVAYGGVIAWTISRIRRLDYVIYAHGYEFEKVRENFFLSFWYRKIFGAAKKIVCNSEDTRKRLIHFGVVPEHIHVLYPAVDAKRFCPCEVPREYLEANKLAGKRILMTTGRLVERKGHDQVIRALPETIKWFPDVLYCIVGIGPNEKNLRQLADRLGVAESVRFMGKLPERELLFLYNACHVFVMPSRVIEKGGHVEGFGIVFLEANACGKPVIGGRSGGVGEAIQDGKTGFLVDPASPDEIAQKIILLLSQPELARKMGEQGLKWAKENFSWEQYVKVSYRYLCDEELI